MASADAAWYLDASALVKLVVPEPESPALAAAVASRPLVTSELTLAEVLVKPFGLGREDAVAAYTELLTPSDRLAVLPVDRAILVEAARQRAALGMPMPDAIHVATALADGCDLFLTNDRRLRMPPGLAKELLE